MRPEAYYNKLMKEKEKIEKELKKLELDTLQTGIADYERISLGDGKYSHIIRLSPNFHVADSIYPRNRVKVVWCQGEKNMIEDIDEVIESLTQLREKLCEKYNI
jgi:hypothetical protein